MVSVSDNNMFVSNFVILAILDSFELSGLQVNKESLKDAVTAILSFQDKNYASKTPIYNFWP
jgi:hypothetical protein